jgi:hypothetical protein
LMNGPFEWHWPSRWAIADKRTGRPVRRMMPQQMISPLRAA